MARIINLTLARTMTLHWDEMQSAQPYNFEFRNRLESLITLPDFKQLISDTIERHLSMDNVDIICYLVEEYFMDLLPKLDGKRQIHYISRRIENSQKLVAKQAIDPYPFSFPTIKLNQEDTRVHFLTSVLNYIDMLDKDHHTVTELLDTPIHQYEQMIQFISYFSHEKVPVLLEKLSYVNKEDFCRLTILPIGNFKSKIALQSLFNLEKFYQEHNPLMLPMIYRTMQKLAFNLPRITPE